MIQRLAVQEAQLRQIETALAEGRTLEDLIDDEDFYVRREDESKGCPMTGPKPEVTSTEVQAVAGSSQPSRDRGSRNEDQG